MENTLLQIIVPAVIKIRLFTSPNNLITAITNTKIPMKNCIPLMISNALIIFLLFIIIPSTIQCKE